MWGQIATDFPFPSCKFGTALPFPVWAFVFSGEGTSDSEKWTREGPPAAYQVMTQDPGCFLGRHCCLISQPCLTLCDPTDCSPPGSSVHGTSQQEYWSGWPFASPEDLSHAGIEPRSPAIAGGFFTVWATREALSGFTFIKEFFGFIEESPWGECGVG